MIATLASTVIVLLLIALTYSRLPWRALPDADGAERATIRRSTGLPAARPLQPDAYAESP